MPMRAAVAPRMRKSSPFEIPSIEKEKLERDCRSRRDQNFHEWRQQVRRRVRWQPTGGVMEVCMVHSAV